MNQISSKTFSWEILQTNKLIQLGSFFFLIKQYPLPAETVSHIAQAGLKLVIW